MNTPLDRPRWRSTITYTVNPRLQIGTELSPAVGEAVPYLTYILAPEKPRRPSLLFHTSADRFGTPEGTQGYYLQATQHLENTPWTVYGSAYYSEADKAVKVPFGANYDISPVWGAMAMYDGQRTTLLLNYRQRKFTAQLLYVQLRHWGISFGIGF